jgi:hypothetical protein
MLSGFQASQWHGHYAQRNQEEAKSAKGTQTKGNEGIAQGTSFHLHLFSIVIVSMFYNLHCFISSPFLV